MKRGEVLTVAAGGGYAGKHRPAVIDGVHGLRLRPCERTGVGQKCIHQRELTETSLWFFL